MSNFIEQLSFIVPALSITFVVVITSINAYLSLRKRFPCSVNCWFCNGNTKVPYSQSNSWECPYCDQYNGFAEDGDYNCEIPAQHNAKLNLHNITRTPDRRRFPNAPLPTNGLCAICNRNQEIKIQQLASFEPELPSDYDCEFEMFRKKLEQVHRLCPTCERHVHRTLNKVKKNVLGSKLSQIGSRGLHLFDLHMSSSNKQCISQRKRSFAMAIWLALISLAILNLLAIGRNVHISQIALDTVCYPMVTHVILVFFSFGSAVKLYIVSVFAYLQSLQVFSQLHDTMVQPVTIGRLVICHLYSIVGEWFANNGGDIVAAQGQLLVRSYDQNFFTCLAAVVLSSFVIWVGGTKRIGPIVLLLLWSLTMALPLWQTHPTFLTGGQGNAIILDLTKIALGIFSLILPVVSSLKLAIAPADHMQANLNSSFHRIYSECNSDVSDDSESETGFSTSLRSSRTQQSSPNLNKSLDSTKSWSPLRDRSQMYNTSLHSLDNTFNDRQSAVLNESFGGTTQRNLFDGQQQRPNHHTNSLSSKLDDQLPFSRRYDYNPTALKSMSMISLNRNAPFYDVPEEFQSEITGLNISSGNNRYKQAPSANTFVTMSSATAQQQLRRNLICPSRLHNAWAAAKADAPHTPTPSTLQTSWVAGGYWNNNKTSPQKQAIQVDIGSQLPELYPMMSRTSSQSSGFESQASSVIGVPVAERDSRESSVCAAEVASVFSSETLQPCDSVSQCGVAKNQFVHRPQLGFPVMTTTSQTFIHPSATTFSNINVAGDHNDSNRSFVTSSNSRQVPASSVTYHQFGTQRVQQSSPRAYNFNRLTNNLPSIQSGSLLKSWRDRSMQHLNAD